MKKNVLLVLSTSGASEAAVSFAVERARKDGACLAALYIIESGLANEVFDTFSDIGFIGDRPSTELSEAIMKEYRQRGYEELGKVQIKAMEAGVDFDPVMEQGEFVIEVLHMIKRKNAALAVLVRRKKKTLLKYFSRSFADEVAAQAPCEVVIFTEE
ncbi:MAG: universal stress protein [Deltaproteobacteria bacterium]